MPRVPAKFYREVLSALTAAEIPFLVGGGFAFCRLAGIDRTTKDLDLLIEKDTWPELARVLRSRGIYTKLTFPHWLGKALVQGGQVDVIFNGGAGLTPVDPQWFAYAEPATLMGCDVRLCPAEEQIWAKAFVMERERFDGADILHLIRARAEQLDWHRLCRRFRGHEPVLRTYLILFRYAYPSEASRLPAWLDAALEAASAAGATDERVCRGTFLSRAQFLVDVDEWGYADARLAPFGSMSDREWLIWTNAIDTKRAGIRKVRRTATPARRARADRAPALTSSR
jgi:hypothetical protein